MHLATEIVLRLDIAQENRTLSDDEFHLRKLLKLQILGLAAVERARKRQASQITWLRAGDTPTAFFQAKINSRNQKSFIHTLHGPGVVTSQEDKDKLIHEHFHSLLGMTVHHDTTIRWSSIDLPRLQGGGLDNPFTEEEVCLAIKSSSAEQSPGPDGFSGTFFRSCWTLIKDDIMAAFSQFYNLASRNFAAINTALVALLPKKDGASSISDYRPISLIHSIAKLISKVLSMRLAMIIHTLISPAQSAFLRTKCIHDSFLYIQNCVKALHRRKTSALLLKLDIAKAFDNMSWEYILELL